MRFLRQRKLTTRPQAGARPEQPADFDGQSLPNPANQHREDLNPKLVREWDGECFFEAAMFVWLLDDGGREVAILNRNDVAMVERGVEGTWLITTVTLRSGRTIGPIRQSQKTFYRFAEHLMGRELHDVGCWHMAPFSDNARAGGFQ